GNETGLVAYYPLNEGSGGTVVDRTANHNNGSFLQAGITQGAPGALLNDPDAAYHFITSPNVPFPTGQGQVVLNLPQLNTTAGASNSVSFWMYWDGTENAMPVSFNFYDLIFAGGSFGFNTANGDTYGISDAGLANRWVHVAAVFVNNPSSLNQLQLYIDG